MPSKSALQQKRETQNNLSMSYSELLEIAAHCNLKLKTKKTKKQNLLMCGVKKNSILMC